MTLPTLNDSKNRLTDATQFGATAVLPGAGSITDAMLAVQYVEANGSRALSAPWTPGQVITLNAASVTNAMLAGSISDANLATPYIKADGSRALSATWQAAKNIYGPNANGSAIGSFINVSAAATGGSGTGASPWTGWDTAVNWTNVGSVYYFPAGFYSWSSSITVSGGSQKLIGDVAGAQSGAVFVWTGAAGTGIIVSAGASVISEIVISGISFTSADTTHTKTMISIRDASGVTIDHVSSIQNGWTGASSIGLQFQGRELMRIRDCLIYADIPVSIEPDPNISSEALDHSTFSNCELVCNSASAGNCIQVLTNAPITTNKFGPNLALVKGVNGFFMNDTNGKTHLNNVFEGCRFEQSTAGTGYMIDFRTTGSSQGFTARDCYVSGSVAGGIRLRSATGNVIENFEYSLASGVAVDADNTCENLIAIAGTRVAGSTVSLGTTLTCESIACGTGPLIAKPAVRAYNSAAIATITAVYTTVTLDSEYYDSDNLHSTSVNTSRLTASQNGIYEIIGIVEIANSAVGGRQARILLNGATNIANVSVMANANSVTIMCVSTFYRLNGGDYVELQGRQDSGGNLNMEVVGNCAPTFMMTKVSG